MLNQELYPAIFQRKSVRSYADTPLSAAQLTEIKAEIAAVQPLFPEERFQLELAPAREGWRIFGYCEDTAASNVNLGFVLQQLELSLHQKGLGRLWFGMGRNPRAGHEKPGLSYAMCLKAGNPEGEITRELGGFQRKEIAEVVDSEADYALFEAVRLAPSARNSQPWRFAKTDGGYHVFCEKTSGVMKMVGLGRMNQVDVGICLCHAALAFGQEGKTLVPSIVEGVDAPDGCYYVMTMQVA